MLIITRYLKFYYNNTGIKILQDILIKHFIERSNINCKLCRYHLGNLKVVL